MFVVAQEYPTGVRFIDIRNFPPAETSVQVSVFSAPTDLASSGKSSEQQTWHRRDGKGAEDDWYMSFLLCDLPVSAVPYSVA